MHNFELCSFFKLRKQHSVHRSVLSNTEQATVGTNVARNTKSDQRQHHRWQGVRQDNSERDERRMRCVIQVCKRRFVSILRVTISFILTDEVTKAHSFITFHVIEDISILCTISANFCSTSRLRQVIDGRVAFRQYGRRPCLAAVVVGSKRESQVFAGMFVLETQNNILPAWTLGVLYLTAMSWLGVCTQ
jgi:hypothetical protein